MIGLKPRDELLDDIFDLDEGKAGIREILAVHFKTLHGYSNIHILMGAARSTLPMFLNDNAINTALDLWHFMYRVFGNEYVLNFPHLWEKTPDYPQTSRGLVVNLARQYDGIVTREQIDGFFSRIQIGTLTNALVLQQELLLFYEGKKFILSEALNLTPERCAAITKALVKLFSTENTPYIILRDISNEWFLHLPELCDNLPWTPLFLQEVLRVHPDIGYRVIFPGLDGQALDTIGAAIVPNKSPIETFADVVHRFCYEKDKLPIRMPTEDLRLIVREAGMVEGNELIYNLHKALNDYRFGFTDENKTVKILER